MESPREEFGLAARRAVGRRTGRGAAETATEVIAIRRGTEKARLLVGWHRETCPHCLAETRIVSTWSTLRGTSEQISWCLHCFNARCIRAWLSEEQARLFERACRAIDQQGGVRYFECARHALEYLQHLGSDS